MKAPKIEQSERAAFEALHAESLEVASGGAGPLALAVGAVALVGAAYHAGKAVGDWLVDED